VGRGLPVLWIAIQWDDVLMKYIVLLLCILNAGLLYAENVVAEDTIVPFDEKIALSFSAKYNLGIFQQHSEYYRTDKPWDIGVGL
jgi:hypothetical protein